VQSLIVAAREVNLRCLDCIDAKRIPAEFRQNLFPALTAQYLTRFSHAHRRFPGVTQLLTHNTQEENSSAAESLPRTDEEDLGQREESEEVIVTSSGQQ